MAPGVRRGGDLIPLGLYLHVPFCTRRCDYCDFYVVVGRPETFGPFAAALEREIRESSALLAPGDRAADTIYVGGGTPSLLPADAVARLLRACREAFDVAQDAEVTLEANPEGIDDRRLDGWLAAGVNRLSVGLQSLDDEVLRRRGRLHTGREGIEALRRARRRGFENLNADLIAGLPGPSGDRPSRGGDGALATRFRREVEVVLAERPDHVSSYLLETDKDTPLMRAAREGREALPSDDDVAEAYEAAVEAAARAGYEHYEISNFCLPGRRSRHNLKYWTGAPYLGFGPSAASYVGGRRSTAPRDLDGWLRGGGSAAARARAAADDTLPDPEARAREQLVLGLRLSEGVDLAVLDAAWGTDLRRRALREVADLAEAGLVESDGSRLRLTARGRLLANEVFSRLWRGTPPPSSPSTG